jgi:transcriptional regulator with XRE-family HTH domain
MKGAAGVNLPDDSQRRSPEDRVHPGDTIRRERHRQHMSMRELARRVGITPSHLSKIERGLANPSVGTLWTVSDELGVPVSTMFAEEDHELIPVLAPLTIAPVEVLAPLTGCGTTVFAPAVDPRHREVIKAAGVEFQRLTPHDDLAIEFMEVRHEIGAGDPEAYHHRGREYGLVLSGQLLVEIGFSKYVLGPGWSVAFDSSNLHRVINIGDEPASAVWVVVGRNQL